MKILRNEMGLKYITADCFMSFAGFFVPLKCVLYHAMRLLFLTCFLCMYKNRIETGGKYIKFIKVLTSNPNKNIIFLKHVASKVLFLNISKVSDYRNHVK